MQIVAAKIRAQAANLDHAPAVQTALLAMARRVRSGDPDNIEAQAAREYWPALFEGLPGPSSPFRRRPGDRAAPPPNNLLDYGYAVLRAALGRAIVAAGLLPALGVQHRNRSNPFCLADDLIEPLRPIVDARARRLAAERRLVLDQPTKAEILRLLTAPVRVGEAMSRAAPPSARRPIMAPCPPRQGATGPLEVEVTRYVASFVAVLTGEAEELTVPVSAEGSKQPASEAEGKDGGECT